ncbi:MAG: M61 family metallopeptidase [Bacteroidaceae bacterium]|nr:M61 family metallopeptidase [Bacteroidaceae bacterium]
MKKILAAVLIALAGSVGASTMHCTERDGGLRSRNEVAAVEQQKEYDIRYTVRFDTAAHYLNVRMEYTSAAAADAAELVLNMPMWTPGYYEMLNFPKHLCDFAAMDTDGKPLAWRKDGMNRWRISLPASGKACATWRIYANRRDVASSRVEGGIAFVAPAGVFMHVDGQTMHPVTVCFDMPSNWANIATGLVAHQDDSRAFTAKDFDTLYDSPFLLGNFYVKHFTHEGRPYEFALETPDGVEEMGLEGDFKKIVSAATRLMGDVPYENYSLIHMGKGGGGLEHLNSQACYTDGTYRFDSRRAQVKFLAFVAHEYFHLYNVKCIRPAELWPFDYDHEAITPMLWVSEGLTCYYEFRLLRQAGIATPDESLELLSTYFDLYAPYEGQRHMSLRQSSYDIWLNFMNDDENARDVRVSYYFKGPIIGLLMDIDIRRKTQQKHSLDDVMRLLYYRYYKQLQCGFTEENFWAAVEEVAGQPVPELRRLVDSTDDIDYDSYLHEAGLRIDTTDWSIRKVENPDKKQQAFLKTLELL